MLKLIVFDCDGVMFDSKAANVAFYNELLSHFGCPLMDEEEVDFVHMNSVSLSIAHIFRHTPEIDLEQVDEYRTSIGYGPFLKYMKMEPDLVEFLETTVKDYKLAISTNRTNTMIPLLQSYNIEHYFSKVVTAATAKRPKPAPDGLLEILEYFSCTPEEAIFIGDSVFDEQHAKGCGVDLISFRNKDLNAAYHVDSFMEILQLPLFGKTG